MVQGWGNMSLTFTNSFPLTCHQILWGAGYEVQNPELMPFYLLGLDDI